MTQRIEAARQRMTAEGIDLLAIPPGDDLFYLLGYTPHVDEWPCYLFVGRDETAFLVWDLNADAAAQHVAFPMIAYSDATDPRRALRDTGARFGRPRSIAVGETMRADALLLLHDVWPESRFLSASQVMAPLRIVKSPEEVAALRRVAATADAAVRAVFSSCRAGIRETELANIAQDAFYAAGIKEVPLLGIIGISAGPNTAFPQHVNSPRVAKAGEPVLADLGSRLDGYMSDITRMAFLGAPTARYREIHGIVEESVLAALEVIRPGVPIRDVDLAARRVIERAGYGEKFIHRTGHGIGISEHEAPAITSTNEEPLATGMAFSVEPGIYLVGEFGVRLEEIVIVTEHGPEVLSALPRQAWVG